MPTDQRVPAASEANPIENVRQAMRIPQPGNGSGKFDVGVHDMGGWVRVIAGGTAPQDGNLPFCLAHRLSGPRADHIVPAAAGCVAELTVDVEFGFGKLGHNVIPIAAIGWKGTAQGRQALSASMGMFTSTGLSITARNASVVEL